tara:strand:+ start:20072 stop:20311 length:240 start_codon:yes stop_codon:yes gene_type:complete
LRGEMMTKSQLIKIIKEEIEREIELKEEKSLLVQAMETLNLSSQNVIKKQYDMAFSQMRTAIAMVIQELSNVKSQKSGE